MDENILTRIKEKVHALPGNPGVYKMLDNYGNIIYIGKRAYFRATHNIFFTNVFRLDYLTHFMLLFCRV